MPPKRSKKAAGKGKSSAVVDGPSTDEMSKDQLVELIIRLREELDREREERSYFQLEKDKIQAFWETSKRSLEESKAELRSRQREREEAEERHRVEITLYKQKLKHVLSQHHSSISGRTLGLQGDAREEQNQNQNRVQELQNQNRVQELRLKHQVELMELTNDYDRRIREMEMKYHKYMESMARDAERQKAELNEIKDRMKSDIVTLLDDHSRTHRATEENCSRMYSQLLQDQREELSALTKLKTATNRELSAAKRENQRLRLRLEEAERKLPQTQQGGDAATAETLMMRAREKVMEKELRDLTAEHELLLQAFEKVQQERDELLRSQTQSILQVQQQRGLKRLMLDRKMAALTEASEKKEVQLRRKQTPEKHKEA